MLLILAGVTIATLTGENGILTRASDASERTVEANAKEQVQIAVQGSYDESGRINNEELKTNLEQIENISGVPEEITDEDYPIVVTVEEEYSYAINKDGSVGEVVTREGIEVGDYVNYTYDEVAEGYSLLATESGCTSDQTIVQTSGLKWRVYNIEKDGTVEIISETVPSQNVEFRGALGYNNGVLLLNDMCKELYSNSELGIEARSINIEDIENQMNEAGIAERDAYTNDGIQYGSTQTYESNNQYPNLYAEQKGSGINSTETKTDGISESDNGYNSPTEETSSTAEDGLTVTQTYYSLSSPSSYFNNSEVYEMLFGTGSYYWLASRHSECNSTYADFGLCIVAYSYLSAGLMFRSDGTALNSRVYLRPVVSLEPDIQITAVENADGSSPENMHQISK